MFVRVWVKSRVSTNNDNSEEKMHVSVARCLPAGDLELPVVRTQLLQTN